MFGNVEIRSVFVVIQESIEFQRHKSFNHFLFGQIFHLFHDLSHVWCNLFLVYLHILHTVYHVEKLFLAHFQSVRDLLLFELAFQHAFDILDFEFFLGVYDGYRNSRFVGTSGTTASVGINFHIIGQVVIDHMGQVAYIQSAGSHIGSYQELDIAYAKFEHYSIALRL